jgi:hypothetical protein
MKALTASRNGSKTIGKLVLRLGAAAFVLCGYSIAFLYGFYLGEIEGHRNAWEAGTLYERPADLLPGWRWHVLSHDR